MKNKAIHPVIFSTGLFLIVLTGGNPALAKAMTPEAIYQKISPALVTVRFTARIPVARFGQMQDVETEVQGLVVDASGLILVTGNSFSGGLLGVGSLTNPQNITVKFDGGRVQPAEFVGADEDAFVSFVRLKPGADHPQIKYVTFEDKAIGLGDAVISVALLADTYVPSRKLGFSRISALIERPSHYYMLSDPMAGFTGSPVVDEEGVIVGLLGQDPTAAGLLSDADSLSRLADELAPVVIPSSRLIPFIKNPPQTAQQSKGFIGIQMQALTPELSKLWNISRGGILVASLVPGSPALEAGIRVGDIITHLNGVKVDITEDEEVVIFQQAVRRNPPGTTIQLDILRPQGEPGAVTQFDREKIGVTLTEAPKARSAAETLEVDDLGITVREMTLTDRLERSLPAETEGVIVTLIVPAGPSSIGGISRGDIIQKADGEAIKDVASFKAYVEKLRQAKPRETVLLVLRGTETAFVHVKLDW